MKNAPLNIFVKHYKTQRTTLLLQMFSLNGDARSMYSGRGRNMKSVEGREMRRGREMRSGA